MTWPPKMIDIIMRVPVMCYCIKLKLPRPLVRVRGTFIFKKMKIFEFLPKLFDWNRIFQPGTRQAGIPLLNIWNDNYQEIKSYEQPKRCGALFGTPNVGALRARLLYTMPVSSGWKLCICNDQKLYVESGSCGSSGGSAVSSYLFGLAPARPNFKNPWEYYIICCYWVVFPFSHYARPNFGDS